LHGPISDYGIGQPLKWRGAKFATIITEKLRAEVREELGQDVPDRLIMQPMGVDTKELSRNTLYKPATTDGPVRLFSCGRLNIVKGHQDLMQAMRILVDRGLDIKLEIAGEDDDGGQGYHLELNARLLELGLEDHVKLLGAIDAKSVKQKILEAHIFALASWHEPLGVAYMEAMSCGVPTIGTDAGGVRELIQDGVNGRLVDPKNPTALADVIEDIINDPDQAMDLSKAGRERIVTGFRSTLGAEVLVQEIQR
jgi:glycosyltransferase involved in cell wall biosynthesis